MSSGCPRVNLSSNHPVLKSSWLQEGDVCEGQGLGVLEDLDGGNVVGVRGLLRRLLPDLDEASLSEFLALPLWHPHKHMIPYHDAKLP